MSLLSAVNRAGPGRRTILYGVGNFMFPKSRYSIGYSLINNMGKQYRVRWRDETAMSAYVAETPKYMFVRPKNYLVEESGRPLAGVLRKSGASVDDIVVVHYDNELEFGNIKFKADGKTSHNAALSSIFKTVKTENFMRLAIGIAHPSWKNYDTNAMMTMAYNQADYLGFFLRNKFPEHEQLAVDKVILPNAMTILENALSGSVSDTRITDVNYYGILHLANRIVEDEKDRAQREM